MRASQAIVVGLMALASTAPAQGRDFAAIDAHARAAPPETTRSIKSLADHLVAPARSDEERARAIFAWIAHEIAYDESYLGRAPTPERLLQERRAVCAGYAALFQALAEAAGLEAVVVRGEARGPGPAAARSRDGLVNHDWNAVRIDAAWRLVDSSWGAGHRDESGRYVKRFTEHYFLTPPDMFIWDHLPGDARWQLLTPPVSRAEFLRRPKVSPPFFTYNLRPMDADGGRLRADARLSLRFSAPPEVDLTARVRRSGRDLGDGYTFAQRNGEACAIHAVFPQPGEYRLEVYARRRGSADPAYECAVEYAVAIERGEVGRFPRLYQSFQQEECRLDEPLSGVIAAGRGVRFRLRVPRAEEVLIASADHQVVARLQEEGRGVFSGSVVAPAGAVTLFARMPGHRRHVALLGYDAR